MKFQRVLNKVGSINEQHVRVVLAVAALALFVLGAGAPVGWDN
ncbi:MAG: hypothetical protein R2867_24320 [Caldilineaceae bacterium]